MSNSDSNSVFISPASKSPAEIASDIFQGTAVESAYDRQGKFSHLLARLSPSEFVRLYSPHTSASIFIKGYWFQLCLNGDKKRVINKETQVEIGFEVGVNDFGITELSFFRFGKKISRFKFKNISAYDLLNTEDGYHCLGRAAVKAFAKVQPILTVHKLAMSHLPVVLILMQKNKPNLGQGFSTECVLLQ